MSATVHGFQTEVTKLLNLLAHSLYSNKEVFLRELISNASDAIDKLHFLSLTNPDLIKDDPQFKIRVRADKDTNTLTIQDNGLGMTLAEANANLGTIAKSGTEEFVKNLSGDQAKDSQLIGQFGVGFYSSFIVADQVTVISRSATASAEEGVRWSSTGNGTFESENTTVAERGTKIILHIKDDCKDFLDTWTLRQAINKYSDHISTPVELYDVVYEEDEKAEGQEEGKESEPKQTHKFVQVNNAQALWTRNPKDVSDEDYKSFYKHSFNDYVDPLTWTHNKVEGEFEYTSLLYIPSMAPMNLMMRDHNNSIKLYVQCVFIMDESEQFIPAYLRFVRGLVDTNALPLNVSRELLQESKVTRKLKSAITKRALNMIEKLSADKDQYAKFVASFNDVLKEGISDDRDNQEKILKLVRFASTHDTNIVCNVSLDDYISRMSEKQKNIYYLCADDYDKAVNSPNLERLKAKGIEVLLLWKQPIDSWICSYLNEYQGKKFISANAADLDLGDLEDEQDKAKREQTQKEHEDLIKRFKEALGSEVEDVKVADGLSESPACLVQSAANSGFSQQMRFIAKMQGTELPAEKFILELNPEHALVKQAYAEPNESLFKDWANLIFMQATLSDQGTLKNPREFVTLMNRMLLKSGAAPETEPTHQGDSSLEA